MLYANYHTHTYRCGHAGDAPDRAYVEAAIQAGFHVLGFTDHCPWPYKTGYTPDGTRMRVSELDHYIRSIDALKEEYRDQIRIYTGLECEYYEEYKDWLEEMHGKVDYLIYGAHWLASDENGQKNTGKIEEAEELEKCADVMVRAMESGLFRCLNHPCHMLCSYPVFDDTCRDVSERLCRTAKQLGLPVEYNLYGALKKEQGKFKGLGYPCPGFWEIAAKTGCDAVISVDAHDPSRLLDIDRMEKAQAYLDSLGMRVLRTIPGLE